MRTRQKGFTLLEMVVVVAVIGILLGIAIPSYQNYVIRSNRTEGQALLSDAAARQERYYSQNPGVGYTKDVAKLGMSSANSPNNLYNLTIATPTSTTYTLTATPINSQTRDKTCGKLTLNRNRRTRRSRQDRQQQHRQRLLALKRKSPSTRGALSLRTVHKALTRSSLGIEKVMFSSRPSSSCSSDAPTRVAGRSRRAPALPARKRLR